MKAASMLVCTFASLALAAGCANQPAGVPISVQHAVAPPARLVAVLEFRSRLSGSERAAVDSTYLANAVRAAVLKSGAGVRVLTRENMLVLLAATGKKLDECEGECEVETGRRLGADLVVSGDLLRFGSSYKLDLRLHDTGGGELLSGAAASGETVDKLDLSVLPAVKDLLAPLRPKAVRAEAGDDSIEGRLDLPVSASCTGHSYVGRDDFPTRATFRSERRVDGTLAYHYEAARTSGDPSPFSVDGEWRIVAGVLTASAVSSHGDRFAASSPGRQGGVLVSLGTLQTGNETIPFRTTWTQVDPRRTAFRFELFLQGKWVTTSDDDCRW